uniref:ceramide-1-phosphate transfer protein-like n=1 Tax=Scatophagus argus TaxID=75038 RepID=UPI001ED7CE7E|nr:ceramide-1-phosphate transfer protein-like [Scatophagus argus]XP_046236142.1 ceramide-1-phosphate transfer protein-like [Scatophagus argus]XP_046236143.1 ceramide-1-phosphate transfer protein-like [Scatophagus argus]
MVFLRRTLLRRCLLLSAILALLLFSSSFWLPQGGVADCGSAGQPCLTFNHQTPEPPLAPIDWAEPGGAPPLLQECPGQSFQAWRLLQYLQSSLADADDVLLEPYLQSWDQLLSFMESLGSMVSFFSQKVEEKVVLIRQLSLKHSMGDHGGRGPPDLAGLQSPASFGLKTGAYRSIRSMVEAELKAGIVDFTRRTDSGCRTLLRLHRSLLWLELMLEGLAEGPDTDGQYKTPGELSRDAYKVALAPHHPWVLRQAAEFVFLALPDRQYFLQLVCVRNQQEATPVLHIIIHALKLVHTQTQRILAEHGMLELP